MCNPSAVVSAQAGAQLIGQQQQAQTLAKYQRRLYAENKVAADANAVLAYQQIQLRQEQEGERAAQAIDAAHRQATLAGGRLITSMAEAGVAGNTAAALLGDFQRQEADYVQTTIRNKAFLDDQFRLEMQGVEYRRRAQVLSGTSSPLSGPDFLNVGARLGAQLLAINWDETHQQNPYAH